MQIHCTSPVRDNPPSPDPFTNPDHGDHPNGQVARDPNVSVGLRIPLVSELVEPPDHDRREKFYIVTIGSEVGIFELWYVVSRTFKAFRTNIDCVGKWHEHVSTSRMER